MALNILSYFDLKNSSPLEREHYKIEALKLAFTDTKKYVADIYHMKTSIEEMLSFEYAKKRAALISKNKTLEPINHIFSSGDTVYLDSSI